MTPETMERAHDEVRIDTTGMSAGKRAALELAEAAREATGEKPSFAGALFMGGLPWGLVHPFPWQDAAAEARGAAFRAEVERLLVAELDADEVDRTGEIPDAVVEGLARLGAFGIKIGQEYGGLGLSQLDYTRTAILVGSWCASTVALISAHQSIGVPQPLKLFGTEEQKRRFLPRLARGELSAFAITEADAGSDPARMTTTAVPTPDGEHYLLNGEKLWCTNGTRAALLVVAAKTPAKDVGGRKRDQITAFVVEGDAPGLTVVHRSTFMGMRGIYNALVRFEDVRVPRENVILGEGRGLKVALATLNTGRLTLPAACLGVAKRCLGIVRRWASEREQWGAPIGRHAAVADKIGRMAADVFALEAMTLLTSSLVDQGLTDIRIEAAMCKMWGTETGWRIVNDALQVRGGRGYETAESLVARGEEGIPIERFVRDARINTVFEGSSEILRLFLAREALDPHLGVAGETLDSRLPRGRRLRAALRASGFYAGWYPRQLLGLGGPAGDLDSVHATLAHHVRGVARTSHRLARRLFHAMVRHGPALEREQVLLARYVEIGTELFAQSATCAWAQRLLDTGSPEAEVLPLADLFCRTSALRIEERFRGLSRNADREVYELSQRILEGRHTALERGAAHG